MNQEQLVKVFKALANESRVRILQAVKNSQMQCACCPEDAGLFELQEGAICCVDEIGGQFDMAQSTISQHLKELHNAGLLERHKKAQWVYYTINRKVFDEVASELQHFSADLVTQEQL